LFSSDLAFYAMQHVVEVRMAALCGYVSRHKSPAAAAIFDVRDPLAQCCAP